MADEWAVTIGEEPRRVGPLNLEKTLRVIDALAEITRTSQAAQEVMQEWVDRQRERATRQLRELAPDLPPEATVSVDEPHWSAKLTRVLPYLWATARPQLTLMAAVAVTEPQDMAVADEQGQLDEYLAARERTIRHSATPAQTLDVINLLGRRVMEQANDDALGEALGRCTGALVSMVEVARSPGNAPAGATASAATTDGAAEPSSSTSP